ncbi:GNAT family N-acetyltransferase [Klebsiella phage KL01]|uniref:GNAT family N-acetyltransferase n=1 Tax=Klebsiella phage KL01 TaxID=3077152 RepID=A0AA96PV00_9CAUD|nr:GNAT family N-acetyltransferase [Sphingobacterium alkalisoli]WNV46838.1 GNAT family N-acetyltransferase [Klebsiella phage KL01]GGH32676.1 hypothetical protein GCM10011418_46350 [Sphingobacterium alkalisoli]
MQHTAKVRLANILDLLPLARLAESYLSEINTMSNHPLCIKTYMEGLTASIMADDGYVSVLEVDGKIVGGFWGIITNQPWSATKFAQDIIIYVEQPYRNGNGLKLIRQWIEWAKDKGAKEVYLSTASGIDTERFIRLTKLLGFEPIGHGFKKEVN